MIWRMTNRYNNSNYIALALQHLKEKGFRITKPRRLVLETLDQAPGDLSAYEIKDILDVQGEKVDTVSIYRILDCLQELNLVHRVMQTGKVRKCTLGHEDHCELTQHDHCHHFLICQECGAIEEAHCLGTEELASQLERHSGFRIYSHNLEFLGICPRCAQKG